MADSSFESGMADQSLTDTSCATGIHLQLQDNFWLPGNNSVNEESLLPGPGVEALSGAGAHGTVSERGSGLMESMSMTSMPHGYSCEFPAPTTSYIPNNLFYYIQFPSQPADYFPLRETPGILSQVPYLSKAY